MISLLWPFFYSCIYCLFFMLIFTALLRLILSFNFPWYFPEKSGNICLFLRYVSFTIQWIFILFNIFRWVFFLSYPICIRLFTRISIFVYLFRHRHSVFIRILIGISSLSFELFSYSFIYSLFLIVLSYPLSCLAFLFIYLFRDLFLC